MFATSILGFMTLDGSVDVPEAMFLPMGIVSTWILVSLLAYAFLDVSGRYSLKEAPLCSLGEFGLEYNRDTIWQHLFGRVRACFLPIATT